MPIALGLGLALDLIQDAASAPEPPCCDPVTITSIPVDPTTTGMGVELLNFTLTAEACGAPLSGDYVVNWYVKQCPTCPFSNIGAGFNTLTMPTDLLGFTYPYFDGWEFYAEIITCGYTVYTASGTWTLEYVCSTPPAVSYWWPGATRNNGQFFTISSQAHACGAAFTHEIQQRLATDPPGVFTTVNSSTTPYLAYNLVADPTLNNSQWRAVLTNEFGTTISSISTLIVV